MLQLTQAQIQEKINFIDSYVLAENAAEGSKLDANANVSTKNIATLSAELHKDINIQINRYLVSRKIAELYGQDLADEYIRQIEAHEIYVHDETSLLPYCVSITMYPFLLDGLTSLGGESKAPKHIESYCGSFVNLLFAISSQFAGAVATVEFLMYFDHFARKDYGDNYLVTHKHQVENHLQHVIYAINQPAAARGFQSVFWNISVYDEHYFNSMFGEFVFPDFDKPQWDSVSKLQQFFLTWFNAERKKAVLTFPVVTAALLTDGEKPRDTQFCQMLSKELSEGNSFFMYLSDSADSLASCCRLRNEISDNTFSHSLGAGGVATGSINVITINMNRLVQQKRSLIDQVKNIHKYQIAYRHIMQDLLNQKMLPVYDGGFITLDKQYLTIGINGMAEAAEYVGLTASNNAQYKQWVSEQLKQIYDCNRQAKQETGYMFNTEFVPAENLGVKNAKWDRESGLFVPRDCYNSYFYVVEDEDTNAIDKFILHGKEINKYLDGGSALHLNLEEYPTQASCYKLICVAAKTGCNYFCTNIKITICNECSHIEKTTEYRCLKCNSNNVDHATRVIGYLKRVTSFSKQRQKEHALRHYHSVAQQAC